MNAWGGLVGADDSAGGAGRTRGFTRRRLLGSAAAAALCPGYWLSRIADAAATPKRRDTTLQH